jgi:hypothetical protein
MTDKRTSCASDRFSFVLPKQLVERLLMAAKISAERDSSDAKSVSFQIAAVYEILGFNQDTVPHGTERIQVP